MATTPGLDGHHELGESWQSRGLGRLEQIWQQAKNLDPETGARLPVQLADYIAVLPPGHRFHWLNDHARTTFLACLPT